MTLVRRRQSLIGEVISTKMEKTVNVKVTREIAHPIYHKRVKRFKNYLAHVASVTPKDGDIVKITAIRPMSKRKRWQVSEIIRESVKLG
jgi:small subunit ribosomal protein S17|tara:strand:- start:556 stop:822 length:267 start_codon:yes stop_codon:yes gene_type:complete